MTIDELMPRVLPVKWKRSSNFGPDGRVYMSIGGLRVIASVEPELDGKHWLHVSVSRNSFLPSWDDLREVKDLFVGKDRLAVQILPKAADHYNLHPHCLHLWCCLDGDPVPDFAGMRGGHI